MVFNCKLVVNDDIDNISINNAPFRRGDDEGPPASPWHPSPNSRT